MDMDYETFEVMHNQEKGEYYGDLTFRESERSDEHTLFMEEVTSIPHECVTEENRSMVTMSEYDLMEAYGN